MKQANDLSEDPTVSTVWISPIRGISSVVERHPSKLDVTGSNPVFRSEPYKVLYCLIAQLAEHGAVNSGVLGSSPSGAVDRVGNVRFYHKSRDHHIRLTKS